MKELPPVSPGFWQRAVATVLFAVSAVLILAWVIVNYWLQFVWLLGGVLLALATVFFVAIWRRGFRWFFSLRALRFRACVVGSLLTFVILYYTEESWRGKRAWVALQREASACGESLDFSSLASPAVPDEQNFAKAPGVPELLGLTNQPDFGGPFYLGRENGPAASWALQQFTDLAGWQKFFRKHPDTAKRTQGGLCFPVAAEPQTPAADVLLALSKFETNLATLRAASQRPAMRLPLDYAKGYFAMNDFVDLPQSLRSAEHLLVLRSSAELAQGQSEAALQDILLALRLAELLREEPFNNVQHQRRYMVQQCLQPIWEGLAAHRWNDEQLAVLQKKLAELDLVADYRRGAHGEMLMMMSLFDQGLAFVSGQPSEYARRMLPTEGDRDERFWAWTIKTLYPVGWLYQDKTWIYRYYQRHSDPLENLSFGKITRKESYAEMRTITDPMLLVFVVPKIKEVVLHGSEMALTIQPFCQQAATACALERYRLAQGQYPATLESLVPGYLAQVPADVLARTASPLKYRRTEGGGFQLYSVGINRVDDGGKIHRPTDQHYDVLPQLNRGDADLVWIQPGKL